MQKSFLPLAISTLFLAACTTSSLTPEQQAPAPDSDTVFSGEQKTIDRSQSVITFTGKSNLINHEGKFNDYDAVINLDAENPADLELATIEATVDLASIETDAPGLDGHLAKEDFFDVTVHPEATFSSTSIVRKEGNMYAVTGDLTIKGITKSITVDAEITDAALTASYDLPRQEFGIGNDSYGEKLLEPTVPVNVKLVFAE